MRPLDLYPFIKTEFGSAIPLAVAEGRFETYQALTGLERAGLQFGVTLVAALVVLGLLQEYGPRTVSKARQSPVISSCIGLPSLLVVVGLTSAGYVFIGTSLGTFFGVPMVVVGGTIVPVLTVLGFVAIGRSLAAQFGRDRLWIGAVIGSVLAGLVGFSLLATAAAAVLVGALGVGAGVRVIVGSGSASRPDERTVPPANKI
ncbi:hypothetical protein RBH26_01305 [Natronolimnohabitans sp. A-GB9]|uniref:hypothetical protein n=1 Tax=Natronolimnohabitans sp. A-GB9 TaxID=3069757 RepID=UPI0027B6BF32|nr:hypothetical protein [Natronolimnohabitans sp. A-GB9]MDQ2049111.1 hypothetical protein [Natronolimnohabitans sp. A-GB9]